MGDNTLKFETKGLSEKEYVAYTNGITDALEALNVAWWCDETPPDLSYYIVHLDKE